MLSNTIFYLFLVFVQLIPQAVSQNLPFKVEKISLPKLGWGLGSLEPYISKETNVLHYFKHHQAYVNNYNAALDSLVEAEAKGDYKTIVELQSAIAFNGGGHINHSLFWKNLAPVSEGGGEFPDLSSEFSKLVYKQFGGFDELIKLTNEKLATIQGSGWAFIVKNLSNGGKIEVVTISNQEALFKPLVPLVAIDAWEHAYYLQYLNLKADYFEAIWNVINWKEAERRFNAAK